METTNRRQLKTRSRAWPSAIARWLAGIGVTPNQVSVASVLFAVMVHFALYHAGEFVGTIGFLLLAAAAIQLRLLCNLLDGLLAVEGGLKSKTGELFNEIPDRIADIIILLSAGFAIHEVVSYGRNLGVYATIFALLTAYVRLLGGSLGFAQDFSGPMAKQHRMFTLTIGCLAAAIEYAAHQTVWSLVVALWIIVVGSALTFMLRTGRLARQLKAR
jgi:phosphatidylglycerophosphate synthase